MPKRKGPPATILDKEYVQVYDLQHMTSTHGAKKATTEPGMCGYPNDSEYFDGVLATQGGKRHCTVWTKLNHCKRDGELLTTAYYPHNRALCFREAKAVSITSSYDELTGGRPHDVFLVSGGKECQATFPSRNYASFPKDQAASQFLKNSGCTLLRANPSGSCGDDYIKIGPGEGGRMEVRARCAEDCGENINMCFSVPEGTFISPKILHLDARKDVYHCQEYIDVNGYYQWGRTDHILAQDFRVVNVLKGNASVDRASHQCEQSRLQQQQQKKMAGGIQRNAAFRIPKYSTKDEHRTVMEKPLFQGGARCVVHSNPDGSRVNCKTPLHSFGMGSECLSAAALAEAMQWRFAVHP